MNSTPHKLELLGFFSLIASIVVAPLALGTVHVAWVIVVLALVLISSMTAVIRARGRGESVRITPWAVAFGLVAVWCAVQALPLPSQVIGFLSPQNSTIFGESWALAFGDEASGWRSISMDPGQTTDRGLRFLTLALAAFATANSPRRDRLWRYVFAAIVGVSLASLGIGALHVMLEQTTFYGVYQAVISPGYSTFVSSNHAAALVGGAALVAFGLAYRAIKLEKSRTATISTLLGLVLFVTMVELDSVGAIMLFGAAVVVFGGVTARRSPKVWVAAGGVLLTVPAIAFLLGDIQNTRLGFWLFNSVEARTELARAAWVAGRDYGFMGSGAGSVDRVLIPYIDWSEIGVARVPTIENEWVEFVLTLGWPVAIAALVIVVLSFLSMRVHEDVSERRLFFMGLCAALSVYLLGLGALHFPFFALGVSLPLVVGIEACLRQFQRLNRDEPVSFPLFEIPARLRFTSVVWVLAAGLMMGLGYYDAPEDAPQSVPSDEDQRRWMKMVPSESQLFVSLGQAALESDDFARATSLVRRAHVLEPTPRLELYLAFVSIQAQEMDAALKIYKRLVSTRMGHRVAQDMVRYVDDVDVIAEVLAKAPTRVWRVAVSELIRHRGPESSVAFSTKLAELRPDVSEPFELVIRSHWAAKRYDVGELWARYLVLRDLKNEKGVGPQGYGLRIESLRRMGKIKEARVLALRAFDVVPGDPKVQMEVLTLRPAKSADATEKELEKIARAHELGCRPPVPQTQRQSCLLAKSWIADSQGDAEEALKPLKVLSRRYQDPRPLARYYSAKSQCIVLRSLLSSLSEDAPHRAAVQKLSAQCSRVID